MGCTSPASMDGDTIEKQVLESMGLSYPFDYSNKQEAIEAGMVVAFDTKEMINAEAVNDFIIALHKNEPCSLIIVKYDDEDALKHVYVLIQQNPELVCESIGNGTRGTYTFNDLTIEEGFVCGTFGSANSRLAANKPMVPIDLTDQLNDLSNNKGLLSFPKGPDLWESKNRNTENRYGFAGRIVDGGAHLFCL